MKRREEELLKTIHSLSEKTGGFTKPRLILIGGYALRAFIPFSRFTRDCDFLVKANGWTLDGLKEILPTGYRVETEEKHERYGFARWIMFLHPNKLRIKVSLDLMEGAITGRKPDEIILIDDVMVQNSQAVSLSIAGENVHVLVPSYLDFFIMKVVSSRASDIRDIASLVHEKGVPSGLTERVKQLLPYPKAFQAKIEQRIIPEIQKATFLHSWRGIFATTTYSEEDKENVVEQLNKILKNTPH